MADFTINWASLQQTIDGFGASDRDSGTLSTAQLDLLFTTTSGIGLTFLRASISSSGGYSANPNNAVGARARGATVWAAPWTPNPAWKSNGSSVGGTLLVAHYGDWADTLCSFVTMMASSHSVPIYAISCQNEPDSNVPFDSCQYSVSQMIAFIDVLGPKLAALSPAPLLMTPETEDWPDLWTYADPALADATAGPFIKIVATHDYSYTTTTHAAITQKLWQTEVSSFEANDPTLANALTVASWIYRALTDGQVNAWHWWNIDGLGDNEDLLPGGALTKRLFALGNWAKFVRPGWVQVGVTGSKSGFSVTCFKNASGQVAIVVVNTGSASSTSFALSGTTFSALIQAYVTTSTTIGAIGTDGNLSLGSVSASVPATTAASPASTVTINIPQGITTLVSQTVDNGSLFFGAGTTS